MVKKKEKYLEKEEKRSKPRKCLQYTVLAKNIHLFLNPEKVSNLSC